MKDEGRIYAPDAAAPRQLTVIDNQPGLHLLIGVMIIVLAAHPATARQNTAEIVAHMEARAERQRADLCSYSVTRLYTVQNKHLKPHTQMKVQLIYQRGKGKRFQILSMQATGVARRSLKDLLDEELKTAKRKENNAIDSSNYRFILTGEDKCESGTCYKLELKPRRKSKYLVEGSAWVTVNDYAIVRVAGRLATSPSFWAKPPEIEQRFKKIGKFWMPSFNHDSTHIFLVGETDLTIQYFDYQMQACADSEAENLPAR